VVAVEATAALDAGAYNYTTNKVLATLHFGLTGPYDIQNAHIDSRAVYTHSVPGGAFRGFGGPQAALVAETQMNRIAEALAMDPIELRRINLLHEGDDYITQRPLPGGVSIETVIDELAEASHWGEEQSTATTVTAIKSLPAPEGSIRTGRGMACGLKNVGFTMVRRR
jgi:CO/xanthine dehydrogenase Mo-binding subunit